MGQFLPQKQHPSIQTNTILWIEILNECFMKWSKCNLSQSCKTTLCKIIKMQLFCAIDEYDKWAFAIIFHIPEHFQRAHVITSREYITLMSGRVTTEKVWKRSMAERYAIGDGEIHAPDIKVHQSIGCGCISDRWIGNSGGGIGRVFCPQSKALPRTSSVASEDVCLLDGSPQPAVPQKLFGLTCNPPPFFRAPNIKPGQ